MLGIETSRTITDPRTRAAALRSAGLLAMTMLTVGVGTAVLPSPASAAPAMCHGLPATVVTTARQAEQAATDRDDVVLVAGYVPFEAGAGDDTVCVARRLRQGTEVSGGPGNDWIRGGNGTDVLGGDAGDDVVLGLGGRDLLGDDRSMGGTPDGADLVSGGGGDDFFDGTVTGAADRLRGDSGQDTLAFPQNADPALRLDLAAGAVRARSGGASDTFSGMEAYTGSGKDDLILGTNGRDEIDGRGGVDTIHARSGRDHIHTFAGTVFAGPGNDWVDDADVLDRRSTVGQVGGRARSSLTVRLGPGKDLAYAWSRGHVHAGPGADRIELDLPFQRLRMRLWGDGGPDTLTWAGCPATLDNRAGWFRCGGKNRRVRAIGLERFQANVCSGQFACDRQGYDDVLRGSGRAEVFRGGGGDDRMLGRMGRDFLVGGNGSDIGWGGPGKDRCRLVEVRRSC
ncbi:hypothetical protein [Nocardioides insulae]|uniref:hypothetical protein n=1 Tax=Nocardioides insulae TaxID=394734 RepID=UPI0003F4B97E|nr:hypothetical protein [Nocardioides insulae]